METIWLRKCGNFLGGPGVNLPYNEGDVGLIPGQGAGQGAKISHAA